MGWFTYLVNENEREINVANRLAILSCMHLSDASQCKPISDVARMGHEPMNSISTIEILKAHISDVAFAVCEQSFNCHH